MGDWGRSADNLPAILRRFYLTRRDDAWPNISPEILGYFPPYLRERREIELSAFQRAQLPYIPAELRGCIFRSVSAQCEDTDDDIRKSCQRNKICACSSALAILALLVDNIQRPPPFGCPFV